MPLLETFAASVIAADWMSTAKAPEVISALMVVDSTFFETDSEFAIPKPVSTVNACPSSFAVPVTKMALTSATANVSLPVKSVPLTV